VEETQNQIERKIETGRLKRMDENRISKGLLEMAMRRCRSGT
jgi:anti-sigma28 factor (negative regulator of flagellin synthesis)